MGLVARSFQVAVEKSAKRLFLGLVGLVARVITGLSRLDRLTTVELVAFIVKVQFHVASTMVTNAFIDQKR